MNRIQQIEKEIQEAETKMNALAAPSEYPSYAVRKENGNVGKDGKPIHDEDKMTWDDHRQIILRLRRELEDIQRQPLTNEEIKRMEYTNNAIDQMKKDGDWALGE